ncbi:hypothetical protein ACX9NE_03890 [Mycobacterium sp. ML4]
MAAVDEAGPLGRRLTSGVMADRVVLTPRVVPTDLLPPATMLPRRRHLRADLARPLRRVAGVAVLNDMVLSARQLKRVLGGGMNPRAAMPMLLSARQINEAVDDMRQGETCGA